MTNLVRVAIDCMGGDDAPKIVIDGANLAYKQNKDIEFIFLAILILFHLIWINILI